jgi:hypothetical protein
VHPFPFPWRVSNWRVIAVYPIPSLVSHVSSRRANREASLERCRTKPISLISVVEKRTSVFPLAIYVQKAHLVYPFHAKPLISFLFSWYTAGVEREWLDLQTRMQRENSVQTERGIDQVCTTASKALLESRLPQCKICSLHRIPKNSRRKRVPVSSLSRRKTDLLIANSHTPKVFLSKSRSANPHGVYQPSILNSESVMLECAITQSVPLFTGPGRPTPQNLKYL